MAENKTDISNLLISENYSSKKKKKAVDEKKMVKIIWVSQRLNVELNIAIIRKKKI